MSDASRTLFGDLHQHTADSDGSGCPSALWIAARDGRGLDFAAITDHDRFCGRALGPATWAMQCHLADAFDEPGRFAAIKGYEFTGPRHPGPGHKCVLFPGSAPERIPPKDVNTVLAVAADHGGIAIPHHVGWTGADLSHHDAATQPVWELCSVHGCYEALGGCGVPHRDDVVLPGHFVRDALAQGHRFGFVASTDTHGLLWHHGVSAKRNPFTTGLAAVFDAELTREGIVDALRARRCYATTGARIELRVEIDGAPMGSELPRDTPGRLMVEARGPHRVDRLEVVGLAGTTVLEVDREASVSGRYTLPPVEGAWDYTYVKAILQSGEMAWSSPIWRG